MFGTILADSTRLTPEQQLRYGACYCGLCRTLRKEYGTLARMVLSYDMTFLILLLSSLYEPDEITGESRCAAHPGKKRHWFQNEFTSYAAAMNVALFYHKCMDDWNDDRAPMRLVEAALLRPSARKAARLYPMQCRAIEDGLAKLSALEQNNIADPDQTSSCFGKITAEIFSAGTQDLWTDHLHKFGDALGRFIYLSDALLDLPADAKKKRFNPLLGHVEIHQTDAFLPILKVILGDAAAELEHLPLVQDAQLLKNVIYSGVWLPYQRRQEARNKQKKKEG